MKKIFAIIILFVLPLIGGNSAFAQCNMQSTAFQGGESLSYNLYFNWQFVWLKVGTASMQIDDARYKGKPSYKGSLITRGSKTADKYFVMRDTLLCYTTKELAPLYFRKGAKEGKRYTVDEVWYEYANGSQNLTQRYKNKDGKVTTKRNSVQNCVSDMMTMFLRARNMNPAGWATGHEEKFQMADGDGIKSNKIVYRGKTTVKGDDKKKYNCLELSYMEYNGKKWKEIVRFFVTDDNRHIPIRLDLNLNFGSAKAYITSMSGVK